MTAPRPTRDGLPPDVRALLRAERDQVAITDDARVRLGSRLAASVAAFGAPPSPPAASAPAPIAHAPLAITTKAAALGVTGAKVVVALALTATGIVGGERWLGAASEPVPVTVTVTARATAPTSEPELAPAATAATAMAAVDPGDLPPAPLPAAPAIVVASAHRSPRASASRPALATPRAEAPSAVGGLREEQELLEEARADLDRGDATAALAATDAHAMRFPGGTLAEAGDALRIRALLRLGRTEDAQLALATFRAHHPHSLLLGMPTNP